MPHDPCVFRVIADIHQYLGDRLAALAHLVAAEALAGGVRPEAALPIFNVATGYMQLGEPATAECWYRLVLSLNPDLATAHQNLAVLYSEQGRFEEAALHRQQAYRLQRVFIDGAADGVLRVLVPFIGAGLGNVPIETLLPTTKMLRIKYAIDYAVEQEDACLPAYDVAFNAVGDPDTARALQPRLQRFADICPRLLNPPLAVARTARDQLAALFAEVAGVLVPTCIRLQGGDFAAATAAMAAENMQFPVLLRPTGSHGGEGLLRCDDVAMLEQALTHEEGSHYLSAFHDFRSADGYYRKYRVIFIDKQPFAYHLAISSQWMVHYFSAEMSEYEWKLAEERRFLEWPEAEIGAPAMAALRAIGRALGLDYGGVDFACLADGLLLLFEANATMLIHYERENGPLAHKNAHVRRMAEAFAELLTKTAAAQG